jgi:hypothetical protein
MNTSPVLTSWKEIAQYLGKGVRTVQRWEQEMGLPVRRPRGPGHKKAVLARPDDLDTWMSLQWLPKEQDGNDPTADEMRSEIVAELNDEIRQARALRQANQVLMNEMHQLIQELQELEHRVY